MHKRKLQVYKLRYVKDILNQARNLNRTSLVKNKNKNETKHTNKQPTTTTNKNKRKRREQHIISSNNSSDNKDQYISRQLLLLFLTLLRKHGMCKDEFHIILFVSVDFYFTRLKREGIYHISCKVTLCFSLK